MATCRITFSDGRDIDVQGDLQAVMDELHRVLTRREHTFAVLQDPSGEAVAIRPEAVLHLRAAGPPGGDQTAPPSG